MKKQLLMMRIAIIAMCAVMISLTSCQTDNPVDPDGPVKHEAWTQELIDSLDKAPEVKALLEKAIAIAKEQNPDLDTNPAQTLEQY